MSHTTLIHPSLTSVKSSRLYPQIVVQLLNDLKQQLSQANCLNSLRQQHISFLNLGNVVYCPQTKVLLFFQQHQLYAYDICE